MGTEVDSQVKNMKELINVLRKYGTSEIADKAEDMIVSSNESLVYIESEIELLTKKKNLLLEFQRQLDKSPEQLQKHLHAFLPDLTKLVQLRQMDIRNLSDEDALLMLTLRRTELIYAEQQIKEKEQNLQFEATLREEVENTRIEADVHLKNVLEKLEVEKNDEIEEKVAELKQLHERYLNEELKIQYEAHQQAVVDASEKVKSEMAAHYKRELDLMLSEQEDRHYLEIMNNLSYLRGIESKMGDVLGIEEKLRENHNLWAAVNTLNTALNDILESGRTRNLSPEIANILQCTMNDDILTTIVSTIPQSASQLGVIPERALAQTFNDIKRVCMRVAAVKDTNASALAYAFSYIKSLFVYSRFYQRHIADECDLERLGAYEILEKADYYIQQGDLEQAAKFMSQLKGVPRNICDGWLKEVRLLLETKQSIKLLTAYVIGLYVHGLE